jgi:N-acyl-D-amino-acid deacylase
MTYDIIIDNATIYDGTGRLPYAADIAVKNEKICEIGQLEDARAKTRIDAGGKVLCPGFIDIHSHADLVVHLSDHHKTLEPLLRQGITTFVGGNCGAGLAPFSKKHREEGLLYMSFFIGEDQGPHAKWNSMSEMMDKIEDRGMVMNAGLLTPHGQLRIGALGMLNRPAKAGEMKTMKRLLSESLEAGALGMSTGLQYFPGLASDEEELTELAEIVSANDAVFTSHLRSYSSTLTQAIDEIMTISRKTGVRIQLSHLFWLPNVNIVVDRAVAEILRAGAVLYKHLKIPIPLDLAMREKLAAMGKAIDEGLPMGMDAMPTGTGFTHAFAFMPPWALEGGREKVINRFADPAVRQKIYRSIMRGQPVWPHREPDTWSMNFFKLMGFKSIHLMGVKSDANKKYEGMNFVAIGKALGKHPFDAICDMLLEEDGNVLVYETPTWPGDEFAERSVYASVSDPNVSVVTDTILLGHGTPSHLFYDCYPKLMSKYARDEKHMTLQEAIRKSTSLPAMQLGIKNRGLVRRGYWADLVMFDPDTIRSNSTPLKPDAFPSGIEYVLVNGHPVVTPGGGYHPAPRKGKLIRRGDN